MVVMPRLRTFRLSLSRDDSGVSCNAQGFFARAIPLLERHGSWTARPIDRLNTELTACCRLPIDVSAKKGALALIANAFNRGDFAMAAIAAVQMQFLDPPGLGKTETIAELKNRAAELHRSGLPKVWEESEHPRTGTPPNPGWFAPVNGAPQPPVDVAMFPDDRNRLWDRSIPLSVSAVAGPIKPGETRTDPRFQVTVRYLGTSIVAGICNVKVSPVN